MLESLKSVSPTMYRELLRKYQYKNLSTTFVCKGYKQANLAIIPQKFAEDFFQFAKGNRGALPLLYRSQPGEYEAPSLSKDSDVRTDVSSYNKIVNGNIECQLEDLLEFDWSDFVTFYFGCSFSFNKILLSHGILEDINQVSKNVSMFKTSLDCYKSGPFDCKMVVSMRAIHKSNLSRLATLCEPLDDVHGAPVHYGDPKVIGIKDVSKVDFGESTDFKADEVPVFWCCGVTGLQAIQSAKLDLAFTHSPGCMFITDVVQEKPSKDVQLTNMVLEYNSKSSLYSSLSQSCLEMLKGIDFILQQDLGNRGIKNLVKRGDFEKAALALSHASSVAMMTGFPVHDSSPPDETDGLPGIISLAAVLQSLGKHVVLYVDDYAAPLNEGIIKRLMEKKVLKHQISVIPYIAGKTSLLDSNGIPLYEVVLSSERVGRATDGGYYSMRGKNLSDRVSPFDDFFAQATACLDVTTIGIGDGGNELGMGKVYDQVTEHIPRGEKIACVVSADLLIAAGVSNWGCYGLGVALYALRSCPIHDRYYRKAIGFPVDAWNQMRDSLLTVKRERTILQVVEEFGIKDGVKPDQKLSVDGMLFDKEHAEVLMDMLKTAKVPNSME